MKLERSSLPVISLAKLAEWKEEVAEREHGRLFEACKEFGFFYLSDHGVEERVVTDTITATNHFFQLPQATKDKYKQEFQQVYPNTCRGYVPLYGETLHQAQGPDPKEIFDFGLERPLSDLPFTGPNLVPSEKVAPGFSASHFKLQDEIMQKVVPQLLRSFAICLHLQPDWFSRHFQEPIVIQRTIFYPPSKGFAGKHTDNGIFTVLIQEHLEKPSLRVFTKESWIEAASIRNVFVINLGDMLQQWTNGLFQSTPHEVIHSNNASTRVSFPFFIYPQVGTIIRPIGNEEAEFNSTEVMIRNFTSIWVTKTGAGRARELKVDDTIEA